MPPRALRQDVERRVEDLGPFLMVFQKRERCEDITGAEIDDELGHGTVGVQ